MSDMFYNYEHNINYKEYPEEAWSISESRLTNYNSVETIYNAKGEELGLRAKINTTFYLFFNFELTIDESLFDNVKEGNILLDILDFKHETLVTIPADVSSYSEGAVVEVTSSEEGPLKYGVYRLHLYAKQVDSKGNEKITTLFSSEDGILSIE